MAKTKFLEKLENEKTTKIEKKQLIFKVTIDENKNLDLFCKKYNKTKQELIYEALKEAGILDKI